MKTTYVIQEEFFAGKICRSNVSMCEVGKNKGAAFAKTYKASPLCWRQQISQNHFFFAQKSASYDELLRKENSFGRNYQNFYLLNLLDILDKSKKLV